MSTNGKPAPIRTPTGKEPKLAKLNEADYDELFHHYYGYRRELDFDEPEAQWDEAILDYDRDPGE